MADFNLVQAVWDRGRLSPDEDVAVNTWVIRQHVAATPDFLPVTDQGRDDFQARVGAFLASVTPFITTALTMRELRFYDIPSVPHADMGDPVRITAYNTPGTSGGHALPPQVALSVTLRTAHRKRWGRFYLPGFTDTHITNEGRLAQSDCTIIANAAAGLCDRAGTGAAVTCFSRVHWNHEDPDSVQVDDIYDVIRRRRFSSAHFRARVDI
jgi:hypothetical protein